MAKLESLLEITASTRILDVGGTPANWALLRARPQVTMLNLPRALESGDDGLPWIFADGRHLPFRDKSFDVVFSNSVIEHVGDSLRQEQFARAPVAPEGRHDRWRSPFRPGSSPRAAFGPLPRGG